MDKKHVLRKTDLSLLQRMDIDEAFFWQFYVSAACIDNHSTQKGFMCASMTIFWIHIAYPHCRKVGRVFMQIVLPVRSFITVLHELYEVQSDPIQFTLVFHLSTTQWQTPRCIIVSVSHFKVL